MRERGKLRGWSESERKVREREGVRGATVLSKQKCK